MIGSPALAQVAISRLDESQTANYWFPVVVLTILVPVLSYLARTRWRDIGLVAGALVGFALAIGFRSIDLRVPIAFLPMGTHWLWHSFGAAAVQTLMLYIYRGDLNEAAGVVDRREAAGTPPTTEAAR